MNRKQKRLVRMIAIVLAVLLGLSAVISAVLSIAYGEEAPDAPVNKCELTMEYLEEQQALRMSQRLVYINDSDRSLDRVVFYAPANLLRRQSALFYEDETIAKAFPEGYLPGGIDLTAVRVNGETVDWGYQGESEAYLRVACDLEPGQSCAFEFDYYLLLTRNGAFLGVSDNDWRLSDFYFAPANLDDGGEFILNRPLSFTRYIDTPAADFSATIALPEDLILAGTGAESFAEADGDLRIWTVQAENAHDFALVVGRKLRESTLQTESGVNLRCITGVRGAAEDVLAIAAEAVETCEAWFGPLPFRQIDFVQADYHPEALPHTACLWLPEALLKDGGRALAHEIRSFIAQQYFGRSAWVYPSADAWLSDSISEFLGYLLLEESDGHDAYLAALNEDLVDALQLTIPGGLTVTSDASLFTEYEFDIVIRRRGAAVFHELYTSMGREDLIAGLRLFYLKGLQTDVLSEMDLVDALDEASGKSWEKFLTDWVFNIGDYVNQDIFWLD